MLGPSRELLDLACEVAFVAIDGTEVRVDVFLGLEFGLVDFEGFLLQGTHRVRSDVWVFGDELGFGFVHLFLAEVIGRGDVLVSFLILPADVEDVLESEVLHIGLVDLVGLNQVLHEQLFLVLAQLGLFEVLSNVSL